MSIGELNIRKLSGASILGVREEGGIYLLNPPPSTILHAEDKLFVPGTYKQVSTLKRLLSDHNDLNPG